MAGEGSRFKVNGYEKPKPLIDVNGQSMIEYSIKSMNIEGNYIFVVREYDDNELNQELKFTLEKIKPGCTIITTKKLTRGSAETCLLAKNYINNSSPLIIANCDQFMSWNSKNFLEEISKNNDVDSYIVTYNSSDPKNSFAKLNDDGLVSKTAEKNPISDVALIGVHYWKEGKLFVTSASEMISGNHLENGEYYIAPSINYLIKKGSKVKVYHLQDNNYQSLGTPADLRLHIGKINEFNDSKPRTIICDIDGTILKHAHRYSNVKLDHAKLNDGVLEKFDEWDSKGLKIILITGRKECARSITEKQLALLGIPYDQLVMNVGNGPRVLINDKLFEDSPDRSIAVNVKTDQGFSKIDWSKIKL